ncbi:flagellar hook-associated protein 2 [Ornithinibacillus californiensis]|uniref:flagellar hook-associated protein 2 n=1 Tax=Ornithinibacillus californiensis TaxID=161536 RepID=UPI00064D903A|nr:flagellar hook-associated protein 2 [Ornithinibacillus californiensis]
MDMRIGGLASGINTDEIIQKLMNAERMPLDRMAQDRTLLEWQRDGYREIYQKLYEMDNDLILDMKMSSTYNSKSVSSTMDSAVTATASSSTAEGSYSIKVTQLASPAINISEPIDFDASKSLDSQSEVTSRDFTYYVYQDATDTEAAGMRAVEVDVKAGDSLKDVLKKINDQGHIRAFYDETSKRVILETNKTGNYNTDSNVFNGNEIGFDSNSFFATELGMTLQKIDDGTGEMIGGENGGTNAKFIYNNSGVTLESKSNTYTMNGVNFEFKNVTGDKNATLSVSTNVNDAFDSIMKFVDKYNEIVDMINTSQTEERYRDYKPLTDVQKEEMDEKQVELWEERAKSGILRGDSILTSAIFDLRQTWYKKVETGGSITSLTQIGISTTADYMNGGKLKVDEEELKNALRENPDEVYKLFSNSTESKTDPSRGLINRLEDSIESTMKRIEERAGKTTSTLDNYTLGKRIKDLDTRISDFEDRLVRIENRYWGQFSAMEQAISRLNNQSAQLLSQFGGGM